MTHCNKYRGFNRSLQAIYRPLNIRMQVGDSRFSLLLYLFFGHKGNRKYALPRNSLADYSTDIIYANIHEHHTHISIKFSPNLNKNQSHKYAHTIVWEYDSFKRGLETHPITIFYLEKINIAE